MPGSPDDTSASPAAANETPRRRRWPRVAGAVLRLAVGLVLLVLIGRHLLAGLDAVAYHVDEDSYLSATYHYHLFWQQGRLRSWYWHRERSQVVPVGNTYILGLGLTLAGEPVETSPDKSETWWSTQASLPTRSTRFWAPTLRAGRRIEAIASLAACAALFLIAWRAFGWPTALAATALLGWNPLLALSGRRAMAEGWVLFLWLLSLLVPVAAFRLLVGRAGARRRWLQALLVLGFAVAQGLVLGLAVLSKYSAGLTAIATAALLALLVFGRLIVHAVRQRRPLAIARAWLDDRLTALLALGLAVIIAVSVAVFVGFNPNLYADPVGRVRWSANFLRESTRSKQNVFRDDALRSRADAVRSAARLTLVGDYVSFPGVWPPRVYAALFAFGLLALVVDEGRSLRRGVPTARIAVLLWAVLTTCGVLAWIPMEWPRWYVPLLPWVCLLVGHGGVSIVRLGVAGVRDWRGWWAASRGRAGALMPRGRAAGIALLGLTVVLLGTLAAAGLARLRAGAGRRTCEANLRLLADALQRYRADTGTLPPWLSCLFPRYVDDASVFVCPGDPTQGAEGGIPPWAPGQQFRETDDTLQCRALAYVLVGGKPVPVVGLRNPDIRACSYVYEFCAARCSWWPQGWRQRYPDLAGNRDGVVSWAEVKGLVEQRGLQPDGSFDAAKALGGDVPILRCFWHVPRDAWDSAPAVLNVRVGDGTLYRSDASGDGWQRAARQARPAP